MVLFNLVEKRQVSKLRKLGPSYSPPWKFSTAKLIINQLL